MKPALVLCLAVAATGCAADVADVDDPGPQRPPSLAVQARVVDPAAAPPPPIARALDTLAAAGVDAAAAVPVRDRGLASDVCELWSFPLPAAAPDAGAQGRVFLCDDADAALIAAYYRTRQAEAGAGPAPFLHVGDDGVLVQLDAGLPDAVVAAYAAALASR